MGLRLAGVANETVVSKNEYDAHKPIYFTLLKARSSGWNVIEDGFVYEKVRVCQVEPGSIDDCDKP